jgi:two-component system LytT family response regulator
MPMMTGFELISLIENKTRVIITSAFREFAVESYDLDVLDYLLKPIPLPRFVKCINKITAEFNLKNNIKIENQRIDSHIFIKVDKKMIKINIDEILFIEGMKEYIKVITVDKTYITHKSLTSLSDELPADRFIRIHKSYTIAIDKVKSIEGNRIQIQSYTIPIGRNYSKEVKSKILE